VGPFGHELLDDLLQFVDLGLREFHFFLAHFVDDLDGHRVELGRPSAPEFVVDFEYPPAHLDVRSYKFGEVGLELDFVLDVEAARGNGDFTNVEQPLNPRFGGIEGIFAWVSTQHGEVEFDR